MHYDSPNWVALRGHCTLTGIFEALLSVVERDVEEANKLPTAVRHGSTFLLDKQDASGSRTFFVHRRRPSPPFDDHESTIAFRQEPTAILISGPFPPSATLRVTASWNADRSTCETFVEDHPIQAWQISQRVLGPFFFD